MSLTNERRVEAKKKLYMLLSESISRQTQVVSLLTLLPKCNTDSKLLSNKINLPFHYSVKFGFKLQVIKIPFDVTVYVEYF